MSSNIRQRNHVREIGQNGPVILYGHGFGCNQHMWHWITGSFEGMHRQVVFDDVGSDQSELTAVDTQSYRPVDGIPPDRIGISVGMRLRGTRR